MAGALTISTLNASSGVLATQNGMSGIAKAWVRFAGASGAITKAFNVSSVTRNATGDYTVAFSTAMPDANYSALATSSWLPGVGSFNAYIFSGPASNTSAPTTASFRFTLQNGYHAGTGDSTYVCATVFA